MRNKIRIIVCIMLVVCIALVATACQEKDEDGLIKLSTPKNLELNGSTLSWDEVPNAREYFVSMKGEDGEEREQSVGNNTTCDLSLMVTGYGNFEIRVRAYGDGEKYGKSDKSSAIPYRKGDALDTPIVTLDGKLASWGSVADAADYSIKVTNRAGATVEELTQETLSYSFDRTDGKYDAYDEYVISVIANPASDDVKHSSSLAGRVSYYNSTVLEAPEFTSISGSYIYWKTVPNAKSYTLRLTYEDDTFEESKDLSGTTTSYYFSNNFNFEKAGKYTFSIRANGDEVYKTSEFSVSNDDKYVITKLAPVENVNLDYNDGSAKLSWTVSANSLAKEFTLYLNPMKPNGKAGWADIPELKKTISNNLVSMKAATYDLYKYGAGGENGIVKEDGATILVYRDEAGDAKVRYNTTEYSVKDKEDNDLKWNKYTHKSNKVDIIYDDSNNKFVFDEKEYHKDGKLVNQDTEQEATPILDSNGKQRYYWGSVSGESDIKVERKMEGEGDNATITFEIALDDVFIKVDTEDGTTNYTIKDDRYYGIFYNVAISAGNKESSNYRVSQNVTLDSQYMSYKIPEITDGKYIVTNAGEYAYIILNAFKNEGNADVFSIEKDINFNGYEVAQIENFKGTIDGNKHTVSGIVIGNKILTESGVVENKNQDTLQYSMFVNIDANAAVQNLFYVGMSFVGYDAQKLNKDEDATQVKAIQVAPIAIDNHGTISNVLVQADSIKAQSADVAGMVINNFGEIEVSSVYATLEGRNVGGVMIDNKLNATVSDVGFYGKVSATVGKVLDESTTVTEIGGAGFAVRNSGIIENSFAIGNIDDKDKSFVTVTAEQLEGIYAGGFVAINNGNISKSYSGEFTLNNMTATVTANGNNAYAGGFVGKNEGGTITTCYSTNEGAAEFAGGFAGYNEASIESCYSTGGAKDADKNSENKGAFVGKNQGNYILDCISYSRDGKDKAVEGVTSTDDLDKIAIADMGAMKDKGYRNPIIKGLIYSKDNTLTAIPGQTGENLKNSVLSRVAIFGAAEDVDVEVILHGDNRDSGNRIVIELKADGFASRYIYGVIK